MRSPSSSSPALSERALDLTWSLWAELGVSGWRRRHQDWGIDPEPLVIFTAWISELDPRLREESLDWCISYGRYLSRARLRNLLKTTSPDVREAFGTYAATLNAHSTLNWPGATQARDYKPSGRSHIDDFSANALIALRFRALFGVGARAETLRVLLGIRGRPIAASEVAEQIDYTKRNVAEALETLRMAGIVYGESHGNQRRFHLNRQELSGLMTPHPRWFPNWKHLFRVVIAILSVDAREEGFSKAARAVAARKAVDAVRESILAAGLKQPFPDLVVGEEVWDAFLGWSEELLTGLSFAEVAKAFEPTREPIF